MRLFLFSLFFIFTMSGLSASVPAVPVIEVPAKTHGDTIAIFLSGDGGWRKIDIVIADKLASEGIHVVGVNCNKYFRKKRTPDETARDIGILIDSYRGKLKRNRVMLIGYSFGADIVPFIINRFSSETRSNIAGAVMLSVAGNSTFLVNADEWTGRVKGEYTTLPEIHRVENTPLLFICGGDDKASITHDLDKKKYDIVLTEGGHYFDGDYAYLAGIILDWYKK